MTALPQVKGMTMVPQTNAGACTEGDNMKFDQTLIEGHLIKRYKRFMADVELTDGTVVTAHCANSGSMMGLKEPGSRVWLSHHDDPKRKLKYTWQLIEDHGALVGINTQHPNALVAEAIENGTITELAGYTSLRREVKYGKNSRIDVLLESADKPDCYVEVKNVHLMREAGLAEFPDSVTARGAKHLVEMADMVAEGHRAVMVYLIQRPDCDRYKLADDIDPTYAARLKDAVAKGVEAVAYACAITPEAINVTRSVPIELP